ncbi:pilus assembly protein TadG-related protein [Nocardioides sp. J54]|uniref:pilus assembly protein TadG-related protein n=1 Tax=Nocardioides sp. J54 TaxID=935866 RepID=UPI00048BA6A3|nr:pilus assembly protein TadG-related protein [Nocardioides sp. J54]
MERRLRRARDERGVVAVVMGVGLTLVLLVISAFAVDLGMQRTARRDMQALADVVALDLARNLDGRTRGALAATMDTEMAKSVARNDDTVGAAPDLSWDLGKLVDGEFVPVASGEVPNAVRVIADTSVDFAFDGITGVATGDARRTAVAQSEGGACFSIGSYAARVNTGASPILGPLLGALGSNVNVGAIDYNGLANADIQLLDLLGAKVGAGTLGALVEGGQLLSLADFYLATAEVLAQQGHAAYVGLLQSIAVGLEDVKLNAGDLIDLGTGGSTGLDAGLNLLDLVTAAAAAATGQNALTIPQAAVNLGPLANVGVSLSAIEAPRLACGRKNQVTAESSQIQVNLSANALKLDLALVGKTDISLSGSVKVASAKGALTDVRCSPNTGLSIRVSDGLLDVDLKLEITVYLLGIPVVGGPITIKGSTTTSGVANIEITKDGDYDIPNTIGSGTGGLPVLTVNTNAIKLIGLPVGVVLGPIINGLLSGLVNPLIQSLDTVLLSPLLNALGIDLSGADIYKFRTPKCDSPKLVG